MSIHAQLSPEAQARLDAMKRNSTISSVVIALMITVLVALSLTFLWIKPWAEPVDVLVGYKAPTLDEPEVAGPKVKLNSKQKPSPPSLNSSRAMAVNTASQLSIPVPEIDPVELTPHYGIGDDVLHGLVGGGVGDGIGSQGYVAIPTPHRKRCSREDRLLRLQEMGGTEQCEDAVINALRWMKKTQNPDGSWGTSHKAAMTGLGLLAYLGHCETPVSDEFGESCLNAITYLVNLGLKDGKLSEKTGDKHWPYEHSIATYALAEATTFCQQLGIEVPHLTDVTRKAGQFLIDNQHPSGGWEYGYDMTGKRGGDVSIVGWHLQALKAMKYSNLDFKKLKPTVLRGLAYLESKQGESGGFGYTGPGLHGGMDYHTLTGVGVLCFQIWDKANSKQVREGSKYISKNTKLQWGTPHADLYGHYYEAQAMLNRGGTEWKKYNDMMRDELLNNQNADGSWKDVTGKLRAVAARYQGNGAENVFYRTALCTLMLEVYYRFLPSSNTR